MSVLYKFTLVFFVIVAVGMGEASAEWVQTGDEVNVVSTNHAIVPAIASTGVTPYVAFQELEDGSVYKAKVCYYNGTSWVQAGGELNIDPSESAHTVSIAMDDETPYVTWQEASKIYVKKYENDLWTSVGSYLNISPTSSPVQEPDIAIDNGVPYVAWIEDRFIGPTPQMRMHGLYVKRFNSSDWELTSSDCININIEQNSNAGKPRLTFVGGTPYVTWYEWNTTDSVNRIFVKRYNGTAWELVGSGALNINNSYTVGYSDIVSINNVPYVAWAEVADMVSYKRRVYVKHWTGSDWVQDGGALDISVTRESQQPCVIGSGDPIIPYVAWQETNLGTNRENIYMKYFDGADWLPAGGEILNIDSTNYAYTPQIISIENYPFIVWSETIGSNNRVYVKNLAGNDILLSQYDPGFSVRDQTVSFTITGPENFDVLQTVKLISAQTSDEIEASGFESYSGTKRIKGTFDLTGALPGFYNLMVKCFSKTKIVTKAFLVTSSVSEPGEWIKTDVGAMVTAQTSGDQVGLLVADMEQDGIQKVYVANRSQKIQRFKYSGTWSSLELPTSTNLSAANTLVCGDGNLDGTRELYVGALNNAVDQFSGELWTRESVAVCAGKVLDMTSGDGDNTGSFKIYAACDNGYIYQLSNNGSWNSLDVGNALSAMNGVAVGDGNNDSSYEIYGANADNKLYQFSYNGSSWDKTEMGSGSNEMNDVVVADGNHDGDIEVYASNDDGAVYQFSYTGVSWSKITVGTESVAMHGLTYGDAKNTNSPALYAACANGNVYQFSYDGSEWIKTVVGSASNTVNNIVMGDGNNDNQLELYAAGQDNQLFQFKYSTMPTATPTPLPTGTMTATPFHNFSGKLIAESHVYSAPNPIRGKTANIVIYTKEACEIEAKLFTTSNKEVLSFRKTCPASGKHEEQVFVGNLANGVYLLLVKAKNSQGVSEKVIKKLALIK